VVSPDPVVRSLPGFSLSVCAVTGTPPINTSLKLNSKVLRKTEITPIILDLFEEGNYSCVATSKYGTDVRNFTVIFNGKLA